MSRMSGTGYVIGPQIPQGLATMVEGLAREILRHRPADVYAFAARHFEELMKLREKERDIEFVPQIADLAEETAATKKLTTPFVARYAPASKRRGATNECGWSIGRTVKVFKKHGLGRDVKYVNVKDVKEVKKEEADKEKKIDYSEIRWGSNRCVRSSSVGDLLGEKIEGELELGEEVEKSTEERKKEARKAKRREYESGSRRQKNVGEIEEGGGLGRADETVGQTVVRRRRRSRSVANDGERSERKVSTIGEGQRGRKRPSTATERRIESAQRETGFEWATSQPRETWKSREKFPLTTEDIRVKTFQSRPEKNGKESKNKYERERDEEKVVSSTIQKDRSESLIVLPSVVTRQSCNKCSMNEKRESEETAVRHSLILPPISTDFSKMIRTEDDVTLPSLSYGRTIDSSVCEDVESARSTSEPTARDVEERPNDIVRRENSWLTGEQDRVDEDEIVVLSGIGVVERDTDQAARHSEEIENLEYSNSRETDGIEQVFKDSLNVTPDSIECSQRSDSLEHLQDGNESKVVTDHEQTVRDERNESNELKRKLMEIETVEKIIENTLVSSGTAVNSNNVLEVEFSNGFRVDSDTEDTRERTRKNDAVSVIETKEEASLDRESTPEETQVVENLENVNEIVEDARSIEQGENNGNNDFQIDAYQAANLVTERNSAAASSDITPVKDNNTNTDTDTDIDTDRSNVLVSASIPVLQPECSSTKSDPSCYVLTEGSPCEIPESVTTVIIPDRNIRNDEIFQFQRTEIITDPLFERTISFCNSETWNNEPFGDRVYSEPFECPTSIDVGFFGEIRDAADQTTSRIEDLENINEEEESERAESRARSSSNVTSPVSDYLEKKSDESTNDHDRQDILGNVGVPDGGKNGEENIEATRKETKRNSDETENVERRSIVPLSLDESGPYVPELNFDSLGDVTNSCLGISESVTVEDRCRVTKKRNQQEIGDTSLREEENTLSSFDTMPSEEKTSLDEDVNDYPAGVDDSKSGLSSKEISIADRKGERTNETENPRTESRDHGLFSREPTTDYSPNIEEEIAQELIKNLNLETPIVPEQFNADKNDSSLSNSVCTNDKETNIGSVVVAKTNTEEREKDKVGEGQSLKETDEDKDEKENTTATGTTTTSRTSDYGNSTRIIGEKISNESIEETTGTPKHHRQSEADEQRNRNDRFQSTITLNVGSPSTPKHAQKQVGGNPTSENGNRGGLWHTSEFHDSLPLPMLQTPKIFSIEDDLASSIIRRITTTTTTATTTTTTTTSTHPWFVVESNRIGCRNFAIDSDAEIRLVAESPTPQPPAVYYAINLSRGLRSLETKLSFIDSSLNVLPCIVRVEPVADDTSNANSISLTGNILDSDTDDLREPLALDDEEPKQSIVIEEISTDDEKEKEEEKTESQDSYKTGLFDRTNGRTSIDDDGPLTNSSVNVPSFQFSVDTTNEGRAGREGEGGKGKEAAKEEERK